MTTAIKNVSSRYQAALESYLTQGQQASLKSARELGAEALSAGFHALDFAKLHEQTLIAHLQTAAPKGQRAVLFRRAGKFLAEALVPILESQPITKDAAAHLKRFIETLGQRTVELAAKNLELSLEIKERQAAEEALRKSERHYSTLLKQSERLQEQLRRLSRKILSAQEEERKKISRELHDVIAQSLTTINIQLANLKLGLTSSNKNLGLNIAHTQRLVIESVKIIHDFARELRPAVLDDVGLIPALHSFMEKFTRSTGVRTYLTAFAKVEELDVIRRTVLYRVAQEAMTNVARHAKASRVDVTIVKEPEGVSMTVQDDGISFEVSKRLASKSSKHLGLLGMRERLEMIGGRFDVESSSGKGTTIRAEIPIKAKVKS